MRILLVEDDADTAKAMSRLLQARHHAVRTADSVHAALSAASAGAFDLIISDVGLPDGSGLELMRKLKADYGVRGVAVSGFGMDEDIRQSQEAGFEQHLLKPVTIQQIDAVLAHLDD